MKSYVNERVAILQGRIDNLEMLIQENIGDSKYITGLTVDVLDMYLQHYLASGYGVLCAISDLWECENIDEISVLEAANMLISFVPNQGASVFYNAKTKVSTENAKYIERHLFFDQLIQSDHMMSMYLQDDNVRTGVNNVLHAISSLDVQQVCQSIHLFLQTTKSFALEVIDPTIARLSGAMRTNAIFVLWKVLRFVGQHTPDPEMTVDGIDRYLYMYIYKCTKSSLKTRLNAVFFAAYHVVNVASGMVITEGPCIPISQPKKKKQQPTTESFDKIRYLFTAPTYASTSTSASDDQHEI